MWAVRTVEYLADPLDAMWVGVMALLMVPSWVDKMVALWADLWVVSMDVMKADQMVPPKAAD